MVYQFLHGCLQEHYYHILLHDVRDAVLNDSPDSPLPVSQFGRTIKNCSRSLEVINAIAQCRLAISDNRIRQLRDLLESDSRLLPCIMSLGIGNESMSERIYSEQHISTDARNMCNVYHAETANPCSSRLPQHILAEPSLDRETYDSVLRPAFATLNMLSDHSSLRLHLDVIAVLGRASLWNLNIQKFCLMYIVKNPKVIFQLMMIDKHEIRRAYLLLLRGIWFSNLPNSPSAAEMLTSDYKHYMLALFSSFVQDVRLYGFMQTDQSNEIKHCTAPGMRDSSSSSSAPASTIWFGTQTETPNHQSSASIDRSTVPQGLPRFMGHARVLESYVIDVLLPFVAHCVETKILHVLDDINFSSMNPDRTIDAGSDSSTVSVAESFGNPGSSYTPHSPRMSHKPTIPLIKRTFSPRYVQQVMQHQNQQQQPSGSTREHSQQGSWEHEQQISEEYNPQPTGTARSRSDGSSGLQLELLGFVEELAITLARDILDLGSESRLYDSRRKVLSPVLRSLLKSKEAFAAARIIITKALRELLPPSSLSQSLHGQGALPPSIRRASAHHLRLRPLRVSADKDTASAAAGAGSGDGGGDQTLVKNGLGMVRDQSVEQHARVELSDKLSIFKAALDVLDSHDRAVNPAKYESGLSAVQQQGNSVSFATSIANLTSQDSNITKLSDDEQHEILKFNCLQEFIPVVDKFIRTHSQRLDHLTLLNQPRFLYIGDREFPNDPEVLEDPTNSAGQGNLTKVDAVLNSLNSRFFKYTMQEMSKFVVSYARYNDPEGYDGIISQMQEVNYHHGETEFERIAECELSMLPVCLADRELLAGSKRQESILSSVDLQAFSEYHFRRWSQHGGMFLRLLLEHMLHSLSCFYGEAQMDRVSCSYDDINRCNAYWLNTLTKGVLRSNVAELSKQYSDQTEMLIAQLTIENIRVMYVQNAFGALDAHFVPVKMLGVGVDDFNRRSSINTCSVELLRHMAVDLGIALIELGNPILQNKIIATVDNDYRLKDSSGISQHFMLSLRIMLQRYAHDFSSADELNPIRIGQVRKLLTFISLLCEGHNDKSQEYLGRFGVVLEVASFVHDMSKLLTTEMKKCMISPGTDYTESDGLAERHLPLVLGQYRRPIIRWISPLLDPNVAHSSSLMEIHNSGSGIEGNGSEGNGKIGRFRRRSTQLPSFSTSCRSTDTADHNTRSKSNKSNKNNSTSSVSQSNRTPPRSSSFQFVDIDRLSLLCELVQTGYEALAEFCQGPCFANQVAVVRAGCTRDFHAFFEFFGAFQLVSESNTPTGSFAANYTSYPFSAAALSSGAGACGVSVESSQPLSPVISQHVTKDVKTFITHEAVHPVPYVGHSVWIGNDPVATMLMVRGITMTARGDFAGIGSLSVDQKSTCVKDRSKGTGCDVPNTLHNVGEGGGGGGSTSLWNEYEAESGLSGMMRFFGNSLRNAFPSRRVKVQPAKLQLEMNPHSVESWIEEKAIFEYYLEETARARAHGRANLKTQAQSPAPSSGAGAAAASVLGDPAIAIESNYYYRIRQFSKVVSDLEASCVKFTGR